MSHPNIPAAVMEMLKASMRELSEVQALETALKKAIARAREAIHPIDNPFGPERPVDPDRYRHDPLIPPWDIGSGLGGLLTPGGPTGPGDPDPTNTNLPPDGSGG